jgi:hypothetical protein
MNVGSCRNQTQADGSRSFHVSVDQGVPVPPNTESFIRSATALSKRERSPP